MHTIVEAVESVVAPLITSPYELVDITYAKMGSDDVLSIVIDKEGGITLNDTADLSERISPVLDTLTPDPFPDHYMLEVVSPGLERPIKTKEAMTSAVGAYIHLKLYQAIDKVKEFEGGLDAFDGETLTLSYMDKTIHKTVTIPYDLVATARFAVKL